MIASCTNQILLSFCNCGIYSNLLACMLVKLSGQMQIMQEQAKTLFVVKKYFDITFSIYLEGWSILFPKYIYILIAFRNTLVNNKI